MKKLKNKPVVLQSMVDDCVVLDKKLSRQDRLKILDALNIVVKEVSESYMVDPKEFNAPVHWVSREDFGRMIIARLNGMLAK